MEPITNLTFDALHELMAGWGQSGYRADQLINWLYKHNVTSFDAVGNLPKSLILKLKESYSPCSLTVERVVSSDDTFTRKYLFKTGDGNCIEGVSMIDGNRHTVCISTQIGCPWGCICCASGKDGLVRNLSCAEIIDQVRIMGQNQQVTNVVVMGGGEPLMNLDNLCAAYRILTDDRAYGIGKRRISVSTAGYIPGIEGLIRSDIRPQLAVSLHAPTNEKRNQLMPINRTYPIAPLLQACRRYARDSHRPISFEYMVIPGFNTSDDDARTLAKLLDNYPAKINLIPYNPVEDVEFRPPTEQEVFDFQAILGAYGFVVTIRWSKGQGIDAACGQLRAVHAQEDRC